jgi:heme a synthase
VTALADPALSTNGARGVGRVVRRIYQANLVAQIGIVVTGGLVRLTGSGLGCPTWPECVDGSLTPTSAQEESIGQKAIEFGNRLLTFVLAVLAIAAIVATIRWWRRQRRLGRLYPRRLFLWAAIPLVGTILQAVLGGVTVLTGLSPYAVGAHFLVSMLIIAGCVVLVVRSHELVPGGHYRPTLAMPAAVRWLCAALVASSAVVVVLGVIVTGSGPHSGDSGVDSRFPIDPRMISWLHADSVWLFLGLLIGMIVAVGLVRAPRVLQRRVWILTGVSLAQGAIGYVQYFTGVPWPPVALHLLGACLVWAITVWLFLGVRRVPASVDDPQPVAAR